MGDRFCQHSLACAYNAAKASGLYLRVKDDKGGLIAKAYATHNQLEYFAELSAMYFVGGNYYPFDRARLARYDAVGTRMLRNLTDPRLRRSSRSVRCCSG